MHIVCGMGCSGTDRVEGVVGDVDHSLFVAVYLEISGIRMQTGVHSSR